AAISRNVIIKNTSRAAVQKATGFDLEIGSVNLGLLRPSFDITDVKLINPEDFPEATAFDIKRAFVRFDFKSLFSDKIRLNEVVLDVPMVVMVIKDDGDSNLQRLSTVAQKEEQQPTEGKGSGEGKETSEKSSTPSAQPAKPAKELQIDVLKIKLGKVKIHTYTQGQSKPEEKILDLNLDETYENVTSLQDIGVLISKEILTRQAGDIINLVGDTLRKNKGDLGSSGKDLEKSFKGLLKATGIAP
ncbi:MAG: AsmA family protein, partial [Lentisphaerota bacterium]